MPSRPLSDLLRLKVTFEEGDPRVLCFCLFLALRAVCVAVPLPFAAIRKSLPALGAEVQPARAAPALVCGLVVLVGWGQLEPSIAALEGLVQIKQGWGTGHAARGPEKLANVTRELFLEGGIVAPRGTRPDAHNVEGI